MILVLKILAAWLALALVAGPILAPSLKRRFARHPLNNHPNGGAPCPPVIVQKRTA
jgi:hypothetical protein